MRQQTALAVTHACGRTTAGLYCWGSGPLGAPPAQGSTVPLKVAGQP